jgi:hypothetical protein
LKSQIKAIRMWKTFFVILKFEQNLIRMQGLQYSTSVWILDFIDRNTYMC